MTNPAILPAFLLRQYVWAVLKANDPNVWKEDNYGGKIPIVPLGEEADLEGYSGPTIIYEYTEQSPQGTMWMHNRATMTFGVRDNNFRRLSRSLSILREALGRFDESARDVNQFLGRKGEPWNQIGFGSISIGYVDGGAPATAEGGDMIGLISIEFDYFAEYDVITTPLP